MKKLDTYDFDRDVVFESICYADSYTPITTDIIDAFSNMSTLAVAISEAYQELFVNDNVEKAKAIIDSANELARESQAWCEIVAKAGLDG